MASPKSHSQAVMATVPVEESSNWMVNGIQPSVSVIPKREVGGWNTSIRGSDNGVHTPDHIRDDQGHIVQTRSGVGMGDRSACAGIAIAKVPIPSHNSGIRHRVIGEGDGQGRTALGVVRTEISGGRMDRYSRV